MERIIPVYGNREDKEAALKKAAGVILSGGIVAYPTESFYGLAASIRDDDAIERLYKIKGREKGKPILILIPCVESLQSYVDDIPDYAQRLIGRFWPGGLTLLFRASEHVSHLLTAGTGKIGIRLSSHPLATGLARAVGMAITGTSANISTQPPCGDAIQVLKSVGKNVDLILDGGKTEGGKGSTIIDVTVEPPVIVREGMIPREVIERHWG
ncbi:MAG: threonylcarbamoyl-AMP synthase [Deltaproteobacteria bacterium]|nr:threonylcarbamoyl-AMP synthase [Deltaproteobacteria bacterium]